MQNSANHSTTGTPAAARLIQLLQSPLTPTTGRPRQLTTFRSLLLEKHQACSGRAFYPLLPMFAQQDAITSCLWKHCSTHLQA